MSLLYIARLIYGLFGIALTVYCVFCTYEALTIGTAHLPFKGLRSVPISREGAPQAFWLTVTVYVASAICLAPVSLRYVLASIRQASGGDDSST